MAHRSLYLALERGQGVQNGRRSAEEGGKAAPETILSCLAELALRI